MLLHSFTVDEVLRMPLWTVLTKFLVLPGHLGINGTSECQKLHNKTHIVQNYTAWPGTAVAMLQQRPFVEINTSYDPTSSYVYV